MGVESVVGAVVVGLVVGALGRLVVPGRQPIGCLLTIALGLVGALLGAYLALQFTDSAVVVFLLQVAVAAVLVMLAAGALRRR